MCNIECVMPSASYEQNSPSSVLHAHSHGPFCYVHGTLLLSVVPTGAKRFWLWVGWVSGGALVCD